MLKKISFLLVFIGCMIPIGTVNAYSPIEIRFPIVSGFFESVSDQVLGGVDVVAMEDHGLGYLGMFLTKFELLPFPPHSNEKSDFSLLVINSYKLNEKISEVPAKEPGIIMVIAEKDGKSIKVNAKFKGNGIYVGHLTFPEAGNWDISIKGVRINHDGSVSNAEAIRAIEVVEGSMQPKDKRYPLYWVTSIVVTLIALLVIWKRVVTNSKTILGKELD